MKNKNIAVRYTIFGIVQGVGFRPFIYRLASNYGLKGWVKNSGQGVEIHLEGSAIILTRVFPEALIKNLPPLARVEKLQSKKVHLQGYTDFSIKKTREGSSFVFISPDIATCYECLKEITEPDERRYAYPFTNCTNCGPRYTIVKELPYDRAKTTMAGFKMCPDCRSEYENPHDRRYHAQPIACPACGPAIFLKESKSGQKIEGGIKQAARLIEKGKILAIKGIGGFHLVCNPFDLKAVNRLRWTKKRRRKPLALMARDLATIKKYAFVSREEEKILTSPRRPIVLLKKIKDIPLIAPDLDEIGFMLPYSPLHHLLLNEISLIVATSSNNKDAPIIKDEEEGPEKLCDYILTHNRPIKMRADDSVIKIVSGKKVFVRRARGYVPYPQPVPEFLNSSKTMIALGGELKDTISIFKNGYIVTSQFLGDLDDYRNFSYFQETLNHLLRLFDVKPEFVLTDLHPNFRTTIFAGKMGIKHYQVQHHYAHTLAVLLEHKVWPEEIVLGVMLDGYGYGEDGEAWGGEFLLANYSQFRRFARFKPVALPGGDKAAQEPWRMALSYLVQAFGADIPLLQVLQKIPVSKRKAVQKMILNQKNTPFASSCGRLFDAVSFMIGVAPEKLEFEAEAAMRLETLCRKLTDNSYPIKINRTAGLEPKYEISFEAMVKALVEDILTGQTVSNMSTKFHSTLVKAIVSVARKARNEAGIKTVALAGGVFLNRKILEGVEARLSNEGFKVIRPVEYSPSDESISIGQLAWGLWNIKGDGERRSYQR